MKKAKLAASHTDQVDVFLAQLEHPLKAEVEMIRKIIKHVNKDITEQVKWNAPSFSYKGEYLVTFNLRAKDRVHLVFHNPKIAKVKSPLLEGDYPDRRMTYFSDENDIQAKRGALQKALRDLIELQNRSEE